jgi:hypothetical protein
MTLSRWLLAGLLAAVAGAESAASGMPVVAELFTSQGCNSCPPADALLGELAREPDVLALAFHVQYWDGLGWSDRFGLPEASRRQQGYVQKLGLTGAFTPQLILNGEHNLVGSNRTQVLAVMSVLRRQRGEGVTIVAAVSNGYLRIALPAQPRVTVAMQLLLLPLVSQADTVIRHGENGGRTLREFQIVREVRRLGSWQGGAAQFSVPLAMLPADADRVAILLQEGTFGVLRGATLQLLH